MPCGRCLACKQALAKGWALRLRLEKETSDNVDFLTLTYDEEHVPRIVEHGHYCFRYSDVQSFLKRLRASLDCRIRFFATGEYGEQFTKRPHYHLIIFNAPPDVDYQKYWPNGTVVAGKDFGGRSLTYVSKYSVKNFYKPYLRPFVRCSQGLGLQWVMDHKEQIYQDGIRVERFHVHIPRYFLDKLYQADTSVLHEDYWRFRHRLRPKDYDSDPDPWLLFAEADKLQLYLESKYNIDSVLRMDKEEI